MSWNPGVSWFVKFHEVDPSKEERQCIYFTQKKSHLRCKTRCKEVDNSLAISLHEQITEVAATPGVIVGLDLLQKYIQYNCCTYSKHQEKIEDMRLLEPLAVRWQEELLGPSIDLLARSEPRYDLHHREDSAQSTPTPKLPLSEFRPHVEKVSSWHAVSSKISRPLSKRDLKTGTLYAFTRSSSPGFVKIGWTTRSASSRLEEWTQCGYTPNLVFDVKQITFAPRVETLVHHELIHEWRRERQCKGCGKSHQEWFESTKERAKKVIGDWARFMKEARPYDENGDLKGYWKGVIEQVQNEGKKITAEELLKHLDASRSLRKALESKPLNTSELSAVLEVLPTQALQVKNHHLNDKIPKTDSSVKTGSPKSISALPPLRLKPTSSSSSQTQTTPSPTSRIASTSSRGVMNTRKVLSLKISSIRTGSADTSDDFRGGRIFSLADITPPSSPVKETLKRESLC